MIFLIEYDRPAGGIVNLREFSDSERSVAENKRLELELELNRRGLRHEVVLLEAPSLDVLRHTHQRYFNDAVTIVTSSGPPRR